MTSFGGVGNRKTVATFNSELSGQILVEDIEMGDDEWFRRLLFQSNLSVVQSGKGFDHFVCWFSHDFVSKQKQQRGKIDCRQEN